MIHEAPIKLDRQLKTNLKNIFRSRIRTHYKYIVQNLKILFNYWCVYIYAIIGLAGGIILFTTFILDNNNKFQSEANHIYLSATFFVITFQFSIKYYFQRADLIHFKHRKEIILKLRKYSIIHAVFYQLINWALLLLCFSPLYIYITNKSVLHLLFLYFYSVSFTLATSMIRKESKFKLRENHSQMYPVWYTLLIITMLIWYVTIFCFADFTYILVGTCVNLLIFFYTYKMGNNLVINYLSYLIDSDNRQNMMFASIVRLHPRYKTKMKINRCKSKSLIFNNTTRSFRTNHYNTVLLKILIKRLLRTNSYLISMILLFTVSAIGLFIIKNLHQFAILSIVTLYISFLNHKQHVEYFYTYTLMHTYIEQGVDIKHIDIKITLLLTIPVILVMSIMFSVITMCLTNF